MAASAVPTLLDQVLHFLDEILEAELFKIPPLSANLGAIPLSGFLFKFRGNQRSFPPGCDKVGSL